MPSFVLLDQNTTLVPNNIFLKSKVTSSLVNFINFQPLIHILQISL